MEAKSETDDERIGRLSKVGISISRMRRFQAKHVDEAAILRMLLANAGVWHTHWNGFAPFAWGNPKDVGPLFPGPLEYPDKVIRAKLSSMERRGLIDGCDCGCRGDWHVPTPCYSEVDLKMLAKAKARLAELEQREAVRAELREGRK